jgi:hypothetical protein
VLRINFCGVNPPLRQAAARCTEGSLRSPSVQRAAAAPQLHKVLLSVALRTTAVLQNSEKKSSLRSILFRNFAKPQRVVRHIIETRNEQEIELHTTYFDTELLLR